MTAWYNDNNNFCCEWLDKLIRHGIIPDGIVSSDDIRNIKPRDVEGYTQCHFFAGIGGWSIALKLAGWPDNWEVWTGSPPCQPFSVSGKRRGVLDERHLAPYWLYLIRECRPPIIFGEQVANAVTKDAWLDTLFYELEKSGYACAAAVIPACSVGAPHIRQRLWFVALRVKSHSYKTERMEHADIRRRTEVRNRWFFKVGRQASAYNCIPSWTDVRWVECIDGRLRPCKSGISLLADGIPAVSSICSAYGNAIVPEVAAEFVNAVMHSPVFERHYEGGC